MADKRFGIWLIGAWGGVSTTAAVGLAGLQNGQLDQTGLVSALPQFEGLQLADWSQFVIGGHEIRETEYETEARILAEHSGVFGQEFLSAIRPTLKAFDGNVRPGTLINVGPTIEALAGPAAKSLCKEDAAAAIERIAEDIKTFQREHRLDHVVVVNLASTEPSSDSDAGNADWETLSRALDSPEQCPIPASSLYAIAAMLSGCSHINFTPSLGSNLSAIEELALKQGVLHAGCDGKTGETLLKSVLAPMFASRNLRVLSWVGHNIFGNRDGKVLDDPRNKASKVQSKDRQLTPILGYRPESLVSIEYIESLGDWKTAWDHIHFQGFLNTKMTLQFTWQGCDSLLAAPLVLDLARFTEREWRRGRSGVMSHLAAFFKSPQGADVRGFAEQHLELERWAAEVAEQG